MSETKTYKKFVATAATSTLVASAIRPTEDVIEQPQKTEEAKRMKGLGIYAAATALTMAAYYNPTPRPYVKPPKTKKVRANRAKNKKARVARKKGRK